MSKIPRREFLRRSGTGLLALPWVHAGPCRSDKKPLLVVIYLRGGQDTLNVLVPHGDPRYRELRPTIAIPKAGTPKAGTGAGVVLLDAEFGLHPALAPLLPWFERGLFAPIVCVGSPHPTRSHFDAQDFMEYAAPGRRDVRDGWLNRYLQATADPGGKDSALRALAMQGLLPRSLRGKYPVLAVPRMRRRKGGDLLADFDALYGGGPAETGMGKRRRRTDAVKTAGRVTISALRRYREVVAQGAPSRRQVAYPKGPLAGKLAAIARVVEAGVPLEVACADYGGWDHHAGEGGLAGRMARMLAHLGGSLAAFAQDLGPAFQRTLILTMSEFGRTCRENGNAGTDHGHGGLMLALGGPVRGGKVLGDWPGLADKNLYQGRDLKVTTDFREVMAEVLQRHMGMKRPRDFFPDFKPGARPHLLR